MSSPQKLSVNNIEIFLAIQGNFPRLQRLNIVSIHCAQANCHARKGHPSAQNMKTILNKYSISCGEAMRGSFFQAHKFYGENILLAQKTNFPIWLSRSILQNACQRALFRCVSKQLWVGMGFCKEEFTGAKDNCCGFSYLSDFDKVCLQR